MQNQMISPGLRAAVALEKHGFRPTHSLGQNFILDDNFLSQLLDLAELEAGDCVLEIGPGPGLMTSLIADRAEKVVSIEMDEKLLPVLTDVLSGQDNAKIILGDAMKADIDRIVREEFGGGNYRVIANLPYYITADLIMKMVLARPRPDSICVMVQKEAAERLMSEPGSKNWCALAATVRCFGVCEVLEDVPPSRFNPPPHVDSCFIRIRLKGYEITGREGEAMLLRTIKSAFRMRRKTLVNNLSGDFPIARAQLEQLLGDMGLDVRIRGEALFMEQFVSLSTELARLLEGGGDA